MRARRVFYEGLAAMLDAGIPVRTALSQAAAGASGSFGEALRHLSAEVGRGRPLGEAMGERPGAFPRFHVEIVGAAEASGNLDRSLRNLAAAEASAERTLGRVLSRVVYPLAVLHFVPVPLNIAALVDGRPGAFLGGLLLFWLPLWGLGAAGVLLHRRARHGGPAARLLLATPLLGGFLRDAALLRWARVFAALEDAGIAPDACALRAAAATGFASLEGPLAAPAEAFRRGVSRAEGFAGTPLPADLHRALATGEQSGSIAESLGKAADAREHALDARTDAFVALLPVAATILAGAAVLWVALRVLGSAYSIR